MIILGIDPGTATTGFGIIDYDKNSFSCIDYGVIETLSTECPGERLKQINFDLNYIIKKHKPALVAIESLFFFKNLKTAMPVSQARGVILLTVSKNNIPFVEYTPLQAKIAVTGYGKAQKIQVQEMVKNILNLEDIPKPDDAADALALAICCANNLKFSK
ncbi:MAG: crossover junction endodeoxyribonuclease RuvC [Candidatus Paceibacterota bacterium]|jgi:crossover junction endodeoxyribonuclease RuvC